METRFQAQSTETALTKWQLLPRLRADIIAASAASIAITPIVCLIDSTIMLRAATSCSFGACFRSFVRPISRLPSLLLVSPPGRFVFCVYFGTYATANTIDTFTNFAESRPASAVGSGTFKFVGTATISTFLTVYKDSRMAQLMGRNSSAAAAVPAMTYGLFTLRDALTIYASFNLPPLMASKLVDVPDAVRTRFRFCLESESARLKTAQFLLPAAAQLITTPIHLLGLDMYNRRHNLGAVARFSRVARDYGMSVAARVARIVPAFGVGGVLNNSLRTTLMNRLDS